MDHRYFTAGTFRFLRDLAVHNDRDWFRDHQDDYERLVRDPALRFITDVAAPLHGISPYLSVVARKVGGSLFRIQRDTRFARDKTPYKTHTGMHFRHADGGDSRAPGFYVRLEPGNCFIGAGVWRPAGPAARAIRRAIAQRPDEWMDVAHGSDFAAAYRMAGDQLARPPRGFDPTHSLIDELRRRDFAGSKRLTQRLVMSENFLEAFVDDCRLATPLMRFVCAALDLEY
jgi:uncharacterized protein (TIGR02453 family)